MPQYIPRQSYEAAIDELALLLDAAQPDLEARVVRLFVNQPEKFRRIVLKAVSAGSARKSEIVFEPSDLFFELRAALIANDSNQLSIIEHRESPVLVAQTG